MRVANTILSKLIFLSITGAFYSNAFSQEMSSPDNQCRVQAKEVALKTYQTCVTESKLARIEQIRKEYQEKLASLKAEYEAQIKDMKGAATANKPAAAAAAPTQQPVIKDEAAVEQEDLSLSEPTVVLKPAVAKQAPKKVTKKQILPVVAEKRAPGEKGVTGVAKTLPTKQKTVVTKPASNIVTEEQLIKTAPIQESELEKNVISKAPTNEVSETMNAVAADPSLNAAQAADLGSTQQ